MKKIHFKFKNIFFILLSAAILSWGIVYTNCGSSLDQISENQNSDDKALSDLNDPAQNGLSLPPSTTTVPCAPKIVAGVSHTCSLVSGEVECWGDNSAGQLGIGVVGGTYNTAQHIPNLTGVTSIAAGRFHTCAVTASTGVKCWGDNTYGEIGNGTSSSVGISTPTNVPGLTNVTQLALGHLHSCALLSNGNVKCWGTNTSNGILGNNSTTPSFSPVLVSNINNAATWIDAGIGHTCAVLNNGKIKCWGGNPFGVLGVGTAYNLGSKIPVVVNTITTATKVALGEYHTCALLSNGNVDCWGNTQQGQVGIPQAQILAPYEIRSPVLVSNVSNVADLKAGERHTCAIKSSGEMKCWGENNTGQTGSGVASVIPTYQPTLVPNISNVADIAAGNGHTCAVSNGSVKCWGSDQFGQLGNGLLVSSTAPVNAFTTFNTCKAVLQIDTGMGHTCALINTGSVKCWGSNNAGQLGDNTTLGKVTPTQVSGLTSGVATISVGEEHTCALLSTGSMKCWGRNGNGQLGDNTIVDKLIPTQVSGLTTNVVSISAGYEHTCALLSTGSMKCWGYNGAGQLGDNTNLDKLIPTQVLGLTSGVTAISAGHIHTCALLNTGSMKCWGENSMYGQLGDGSTLNQWAPAQVVGLTSGVTTISAGYEHTCALLSTGSMKCWGWNQMGQLGNFSPNLGNNVPTQVTGLTSGVISISTGDRHSCALLNTGSMKCWGFDQFGQLGDATNIDKYVPTQVSGLTSGVSAISAGDVYTCALLKTGEVDCWGENGNGKLGDGTIIDRWIPTKVQGLP